MSADYPKRIKSTQSVGFEGEEKACKFLEKSGYQIVKRNWRSPHGRGEIDIVAIEDETLVFFEVKTYPHADMQTIEMALGVAKQKRIVETAKCFINMYRQYSNSYIRFDVLLIDVPQFMSDVYHIVNAFSESV